MDEKIQAKLESYIEFFDIAKQKVGDEAVALTLLQELSKDRRMEEMKQHLEAKNGEAATEKQKRFMKKLGINFPATLSKREASMLIDEELGRNGNGE